MVGEPTPAEVLGSGAAFGADRGSGCIPHPSHGVFNVSRAWFQHLVASEVNDRIQKGQVELEHLDRGGTGSAVQQLKEKLRGKRWMTINDLVHFSLCLGPQVLPYERGSGRAVVLPPKLGPFIGGWPAGQPPTLVTDKRRGTFGIEDSTEVAEALRGNVLTIVREQDARDLTVGLLSSSVANVLRILGWPRDDVFVEPIFSEADVCIDNPPIVSFVCALGKPGLVGEQRSAYAVRLIGDLARSARIKRQDSRLILLSPRQALRVMGSYITNIESNQSGAVIEIGPENVHPLLDDPNFDSAGRIFLDSSCKWQLEAFASVEEWDVRVYAFQKLEFI